MSNKTLGIQQREKVTYDGINRTINMQFRVNEKELKMIEQRMLHIGTMNRSGFLRKMALNGICIVVDVKELREVTKLLCSMSNNMNQYAKKANAIGNIYLEDIDSMKEKQSELMQTYGKVLSELDKISAALEKLTYERGSVL